jgi:hypothetical protein
MPIKPEMRGFYSSDWPEISRRVRFERAAGVCQGCGRPHGITVHCLLRRDRASAPPGPYSAWLVHTPVRLPGRSNGMQGAIHTSGIA